MQPNSELLRGSLGTILLNLLAEHGKMYGYEMIRKVKEASDSKILLTEGALYPALHKLEASGLLTVSIENMGNRNRKYYTLTKTGKTASKVKLWEIAGFIEQMQQLLKLKTAL